jgi:hypothetical protein
LNSDLVRSCTRDLEWSRFVNREWSPDDLVRRVIAVNATGWRCFAGACSLVLHVLAAVVLPVAHARAHVLEPASTARVSAPGDDPAPPQHAPDDCVVCRHVQAHALMPEAARCSETAFITTAFASPTIDDVAALRFAVLPVGARAPPALI